MTMLDELMTLLLFESHDTLSVAVEMNTGRFIQEIIGVYGAPQS